MQPSGRTPDTASGAGRGSGGPGPATRSAATSASESVSAAARWRRWPRKWSTMAQMRLSRPVALSVCGRDSGTTVMARSSSPRANRTAGGKETPDLLVAGRSAATKEETARACACARATQCDDVGAAATSCRECAAARRSAFASLGSFRGDGTAGTRPAMMMVAKSCGGNEDTATANPSHTAHMACVGCAAMETRRRWSPPRETQVKADRGGPEGRDGGPRVDVKRRHGMPLGRVSWIGRPRRSTTTHCAAGVTRHSNRPPRTHCMSENQPLRSTPSTADSIAPPPRAGPSSRSSSRVSWVRPRPVPCRRSVLPAKLRSRASTSPLGSQRRRTG
mmetsp:Transcript_18826/g.44094  ORF Transcript_18826/g.44094 Transcript_18826/m.44094 type:complete len:334 (-) Transcript_18826:1078-2079(-)